MIRLFAITLTLVCVGSIPVRSQPPGPPKKDSVEALKATQAKLVETIRSLQRELVEQADALENTKEEYDKRIKQMQRRIAILEAELKKTAPPISAARKETLAIIHLLEQSVETKGLQEPVHLKVAYEYFSDKFSGKLPILVDKGAFADEPDADDPHETKVRLPAYPANMRMDEVLHTILAPMSKTKATFAIRPGWIEITTAKASKAANAISRPSIHMAFDRRPLPEVVQQLADQAGVTVHLDPNIGASADTRISATFRNASLQEALATVTEMAKLKFVVMERSIYVTTPEHARAIEKDEAIRSKKRASASRVATGIPGLPKDVHFADPGPDRAAIGRMLEQSFESKGLQEKVKMRTALQYMWDKFGEKLVVLVNNEAFWSGKGDVPDLYEDEVSLPPTPAKMRADTALRLLIAQIGDGQATYVIRKGWIEITSEKATRATNSLYHPCVIASFDARPLAEILGKLSEQADVPINIDPNIRATMPISATFLNGSLEEALVTVTEMTKLKYVVLERSIYVTTPDHARAMEADEQKRSKQRELVPPNKSKRLEAPA